LPLWNYPGPMQSGETKTEHNAHRRGLVSFVTEQIEGGYWMGNKHEELFLSR
jgi:hypothetical protein